jgi:N-acetylneuraminic acid mutarotase
MKRVSRYLWIICFLAALFALAGTLKASLPQIATGTWTSWTTLSQARANASSVLLPDGRILIEGGDSGGGPLQSAEIFATDGTVSSATSMNVARSHHFAVALSDGRVLVGGGITSGGGTTNSAELYDPAADSWASVPAMITARANATAVLLQDGRVFIAGGDNAGATDNTIEIYDPTTGNGSLARRPRFDRWWVRW